jgi:hypothetical protein
VITRRLYNGMSTLLFRQPTVSGKGEGVNCLLDAPMLRAQLVDLASGCAAVPLSISGGRR